jgi:hypothetical protein
LASSKNINHKAFKIQGAVCSSVELMEVILVAVFKENCFLLTSVVVAAGSNGTVA